MIFAKSRETFKNGVIDEEIMSTLFSHTIKNNKIVGAYRLYIPVETFDDRGNYHKLKPIEDQNKIINFVAEFELPEVDFGVVLPPNATENTFLNIENVFSRIKKIIANKGKTKARLCGLSFNTYRGIQKYED